MPRSTVLLAPLFVVATFVGCTQDQVVGRYKTAICETDVLPIPAHVATPIGAMPEAAGPTRCASVIPTASVSIDSIPTPPSPTADVTGTSLPERAQMRYITELAKYSKSAEDLRGNLAATIGLQNAASGVDDRTVFHRTLVVSVRKGSGFNPADRLEATDVLIRPVYARFDNWNTLVTVYTTINAGTVQLTQARNLTENLTAGPPGSAPVSGSLSLGGSQTDTRAENLSALSTLESLTATIENGALRIRRQGGYGVDLTGNTIVKVDLSFTRSSPELLWVFSAQSYLDKNGHWLPAQQVSLVGKPVRVLPSAADIDADVFLTYTIRHVWSGGETYEEKDDEILERTVGPVYQKTVLVPAREALPPIFGIHLNGKNGQVLEITAPGLAPTPLCFDAYTDALNFMAYMRAGNASHPDRIGNAMLSVPDPEGEESAPLTRPDLNHAQVQPTCT
jgi:hypothetical protein